MGMREQQIYKLLHELAPVTISTESPECLGVQLAVEPVGAPTSTAWGTANRALYLPFLVRARLTVARLFYTPGATIAGNVDMGICDEAGTRLVSMGTTAMAGTSANLTFLDVTDTTLNPGRYYLGIALSDATATLWMWTVTSGVAAHNAWGVRMEAAAFPLPATATFALSAMTSTPRIGLTRRASA